MLDGLHMQWSGATPHLVNSDGEPLGKANNSINTFCTYALSSTFTCFSCHVRVDGKSLIVPIKRHSTNIALHESGRIIPPAILWMFMTGDFKKAIEEGMLVQGMTGSYTIVQADAEMLITHGVEPAANAPSCSECHGESGTTADDEKMLPFAALGYHNVPEKVRKCSLCHEQKSLDWKQMHEKHRDDGISCASCHSGEPRGFIESQYLLCLSCHEIKQWDSEAHKQHLE